MATAEQRRLVIVESPAKAKTIAGYLGSGYDVEASIGHIRDLPNPSDLPTDMKKGPYGKFAVDVDNGFDPYYIVDADKRRTVTELKRLLKNASELYLATDEDREGEAIAWHLLEVLKPKVPVKRMVFHEITKEAIQNAVSNTRDLDVRLVDAQETRRILDRLYGYEVSPVLWRKVRQGLSAGRVQSVATRIIVERERARMAFRSAAYWDVMAQFAPPATPAEAFRARLSSLDGARVATGRDFGDDGRLKSAGAVHLDQAAATAIAVAVTSAERATVSDVQERPYTRRPAAPFTTSTLQQEAGRKLRLSSRNAMRVAQRLYENGFITYMRTDSTALSATAVTAARAQARDMYGAESVPSQPRQYDKKVKNAQEAHEAIRPAGDRFRTELIWQRTVASQMADARGSTATLRVTAPLEGAAGYRAAEFSASGTVITFPGFLAAYQEGWDDDESAAAGKGGGSGAGATAGLEENRRLPKLSIGVELDTEEATPGGHETAPPARYTEASLIKAMEELGIGRPSTYAATVATIQDRGYVHNRGQALVPTWLAFAVTRLLEEHFPRLVDYEFTARMEEDLDEIASGEQRRIEWLRRFYFGDEATSTQGLRDLVEDLGDIDAREVSTIHLGEGMVVRVGRYGPYVEELQSPGGVAHPPAGQDDAGATPKATDGADDEKGGQPRRASITDDIAPDEMTPAKARELLDSAADDGRVLGTDPQTGREIVAKAGRFGPYVTEVLPEPDAAGEAKPKRGAKAVKAHTASLFKEMDLATLTLDDALQLLSLPRVVGANAEGVEITAQNGRYGPYLKCGTDSRSLESERQLLTITLDEALAVYTQPKTRGRAAAKPPLAQFGDDPVSGRPVSLKDGRFGPYVTDGETNATLRRDDDPVALTQEQAFELLADKRAKGPTTRKRTAKTATKAPAKKTTKATAAKSTTTPAKNGSVKRAPRKASP